MGYRIKSVADLVGVPRNTLLAWERRYGLVTPERQDNGYREYSANDVARLRKLKALIDAGHRVGEAVSLLSEREDARSAQQVDDLHRVQTGAFGDDALTQRLREALLRFDRDSADRIAAGLETRPYRDRVEHIYFPVLRVVGERWAAGEINVSQEHFASAWCREKMMAMLMALGHGPQGGPVALCAGFPGERHELGLLGVAIQLALQGYRISWLGADVPTDDLAQAVRQEAPAMVCISVLQPRTRAEFQAYAQQLREAAPTGTRVVIGGVGVPEKGAPAIEGIEWISQSGRLDS